jgi:phage terminase Nu1 subunit (DNA packaging protein)
MEKPMNETASNAEMMELFGVSDRTVAKHAASGIFVRVGRGQYDVKASIRTYAEHLRSAASGRPSTNEELRAEKIRLTAAQADRAEMDRDAEAEVMVNVKEFDDAWGHEIVKLRQGFLGLANKIAEAHPHFTRHEIHTIDEVIRAMMERVADDADTRLEIAQAKEDKGGKSRRRSRR